MTTDLTHPNPPPDTPPTPAAPRNRRWTALAATAVVTAVAAIPVAAAAAPAGAETEAVAVRQGGTLSDGSTYALWRPAEWNGDLVVLPGREALDATAVRWLIEQGYGAVGYDLSSGWDLEQDRDNAEEALGALEDVAAEQRAAAAADSLP
jgi:hypothetical protein